MSEPVVPPPPAGPKKGLSTGAKVAIGCLVAVVLCVGGCFVVGGFFVTKGVKSLKSFAETAQKDPDLAAYKAALIAFKLNPDVEIVSSDESAKTITVRDKTDGKEITFNLADIKAGRLSMTSGEDEVKFEGNSAPDGKTGSFKITSNKGTMVLGGDAQVPDWVPVYPGARTEGQSLVASGGESTGSFSLEIADGADRVLAYYEHALKAKGYTVEKTSLDSTNATGGTLNATSGARTISVTVANQEGQSQGMVQFSEKSGTE